MDESIAHPPHSDKRSLFSDKFIKRFWSRVEMSGPDDCWNWVAGKTSAGYGHLRAERRWFYAHRVSYQLTFGEIPDRAVICHRCDNPGCVNPSHLFAGSQLDNMEDRDRKGRSPLSIHPAKAAEIITRLMTEDISQSELARQYGIDPSTISRWASRQKGKAAGRYITNRIDWNAPR